MGCGGWTGVVFWLFICIGEAGFAGGVRGAAAAESGLTEPRLDWLPAQPRQGDVVRLSLQGAAGTRVRSAEAGSQALFFFPVRGQDGHWEAFYGIDAEQEAGAVEIMVLTELAGETEPRTLRARMEIGRREFAEERLTLPDRMVRLSPGDLKRVRGEEEVISSLWPVRTSERVWDGPFGMPLAGRPGSPFGLRRWINGERRSFHTGMDVKVAEGAPVRAANAGTVALTGDFYFGGKSVFLDHGQGIYTMYFHLSGIRVKSGARVGKGEVVGWAGRSGRASGPHLHWGVRLAGARVDPLSLIAATGGAVPDATTGKGNAGGEAAPNR